MRNVLSGAPQSDGFILFHWSKTWNFDREIVLSLKLDLNRTVQNCPVLRQTPLCVDNCTAT